MSTPATSASPRGGDGGSPGTLRLGARRAIDRSAGTLETVGLGWLLPLLRIGAGEDARAQLGELRHRLVIPLLGITLFLVAWAVLAPRVQTSLGAVPGPAAVFAQVDVLWQDHLRERDKAVAFAERQEVRNAKLIAEGRADRVKERAYTGKPTYVDQILTSLGTVALGFGIATIIAVPLGIASGMSRSVSGALNPLIQLFKPVSPLAWLPIVTMVVSALYVNPSDLLPKALVVSAITVTLCSLWPTLINTALGVASVDKDLVNVGRVLQLSTWQRVTKVVLPSALPLIFTGPPALARRRLDGADRRRDARAEPRSRQVRLGRVPERLLRLARPHHARGADDRTDRLPARQDHVRAAERVHLLRHPLSRRPDEQHHPMSTILELSDLSKGYGEGAGRTEVLAGLNLRVEEGEFVAVLGFSGAGKTTLISLLAGLEEPDRGGVLFRGREIDGPAAERAVVFQSYSLMPWLSVRGNVALAVDSVSRNAPADRSAGRSGSRPSRRPDGGSIAAGGPSASSATSTWSASRTRASGVRPSSRGACASAWRWPARSPCSRNSCCSTSRCRRSTP